jgi:hypothetical protein
MTIDQRIIQTKVTNPKWGQYRIAKELGVSREKVRWVLSRGQPAEPEKPRKSVETLTELLKQILTKGPATPASLEVALGVSWDELGKAIEELSKTHAVAWQGAFLTMSKPEVGFLHVSFLDAGGQFEIGLVADTHLACKEERLDALHNQYDLFEKQGIRTVLHAGNIVDGYVPRINGASVICASIDDQCQYVADNYPRRKGVTTHFITGDDHEGWWQKEGFNFGWYLEQVLKRNERGDLKYIGHVEADVDVVTPNGAVKIKVQHPGGGSAYARSYTGQKQVESFQGGEKPHILVQGHYHVSNYMVDRNVHVIGLPGFQDQTVFARKKRLRMEVGGAILAFTVTEAGSVGRLSVEFNHYFDRGFYKPFLRSDRRLLKGHLTIKK